MKNIKQRIELHSELGLPSGFMELDVYRGFSSVSDVETFMYGKDIPEKGYMIIMFFDMYYAILYKDTNNLAVVGADIYWKKDNGYWTQEKTQTFKLFFEADKVQKTGYSNPKIVEDLHFLDEEILVYNTYKNGWRNVLDIYQYAPSFLDYLCRTFYQSDFEKDELDNLHQYFKKSEIQSFKLLLEEYEGSKLNPFKGEIVKNGKRFPIKMPQ